MPANLFSVGIGVIVVARKLPLGGIGMAYFLLDIFCLRVKVAFFSEMGEHELQARLEEQYQSEGFTDIEPTYARKLVRDAAAYAAALGLAAAKDTPVIEAIFGDIDAGACTETFTFGKDGKPFYVSGPYDTPARIREISRALDKSRGAGKWEYVIGVSPDL